MPQLAMSKENRSRDVDRDKLSGSSKEEDAGRRQMESFPRSRARMPWVDRKLKQRRRVPKKERLFGM
jgi:hypothetical protein